MKRKLKRDVYAENGEIMLEASLIYVMVIFLLTALLSISFMYYQKAMIVSVAQEIAVDIAKNYKYDVTFDENEVGKTYIVDNEDLKSVNIFRSTFGKGNIEDEQKTRVENYILDERIQAATLGINSGNIVITQCDVKRTGLGRTYVTVTIAQETEFFLSGVLEGLGIASKRELFESTARAECNDLIGYTSTVNLALYCTNALTSINFVSAADGMVTSIRDFVDKLGNLFD